MCHLVAVRLARVDSDGSLGSRFDTHMAGCLTCQAEAARYRKMYRSLAGLATLTEQPPHGFAPDVAAALGADTSRGRSPSRRGRVAAATGAIAATAAGVVAVALWRRARQAA